MSEDTAKQRGGGSLFRLFVEVFSIVAALLLFTSAYIQYRLFVGLDLPFFLVASTEDILLGGFSILATVLDQFFRWSFWFALPTHLILFAAIVLLSFELSALLRLSRWWQRMLLVIALTVAFIAFRAALAQAFPLQGSSNLFENVVRTSLGPVDANGPLGLWSYLIRLVGWTVLVALPIAFLAWVIRWRDKALPSLDEARAFVRSMGGFWLALVFVVVAATAIPAAIVESFSWGKGKVTSLTPKAALDGCEDGDVFVVWSGAKAEVLRCFTAEGERDFVVLRAEHTVVELERQNVRGSTLETLEP